MAAKRKRSLFSSILAVKCPHCRRGDMFETGHFSWKKPFEMRSHCPVCNQDFEPEIGFYYGAMFISYIFTGFFALFFVMIVHWVFGWSLFASFVALVVVLGFFFVYIFRLARSIWIHIIVAYDPKAVAET